MINQYFPVLTCITKELNASVEPVYFGDTFNQECAGGIDLRYLDVLVKNRNHYKRLLWFPIRIPTNLITDALKKIRYSGS